VTKMPAFSALCGLGGRVGRSDYAAAGETSDGFAVPGNMKWVDRDNQGGSVLLSPFSRI